MQAHGWLRFGLTVGMLAGCGGGDGDDPPLPGPDAPPVATTVNLRVYTSTTGSPPAVLAYRDDGGAWQDIPLTPQGRYNLVVHGRYEVLAVCGNALSGYDTELRRATPVDGELTMFCFGGTSTQPAPPTPVTGTMMQPGEVTIGGASDTSTTGSWTFDIDVPEGQNDLIAFDAERIELRRDLDLQAAIAPVDLAAGHAFTKTGVIVDGRLPDDEVSTSLMYATMGGFMMLNRPGTVVTSVPNALLDAYDFQFASVEATTPTTRRSHDITDEDRIELLPRLEGIEIDGYRATWSTLPAGETLRLALYASPQALTVEATAAWFDGRTELAFPTDLPAGMPAGAVPAASALEYQTLTLTATGGERSTSYNPPVADRSLRRISDEQHRRRASLARAKLRR